MIKKIALSSLLAMVLIGCGSDSSSTAQATKVTEISGLEGFWDISHKIEGKHDEMYAYYFANGEIGIYDYQKDSYNKGKDCYKTGYSYSEIRQNVAGSFYFYNTKTEEKGLVFDAEISKDELTLINPFKPDEVKVYKHPPVTLTDIEAKLCQE